MRTFSVQRQLFPAKECISNVTLPSATKAGPADRNLFGTRGPQSAISPIVSGIAHYFDNCESLFWI